MSYVEGCSHPKSKHKHGTTRQAYFCCLSRPAGPCERCRRVNRRVAKEYKLRRLRGVEAQRPAVGPRRRVQALFALGWTTPEMAAAGGAPRRGPALLKLAVMPNEAVHAETEACILRAYRALAWRVPPEENRFRTTVRKRTRNKAARLGWVTPAAWDDDIDDPGAEPHGVVKTARQRYRDSYDRDDPVLVQRVCEGDYPPTALGPKQRVQAIRFLAIAWRWSDSKIAEHLALSERHVARLRSQHGIESRWTPEAA